MFPGVVGKLVIGKDCSWNNVGPHMESPTVGIAEPLDPLMSLYSAAFELLLAFRRLRPGFGPGFRPRRLPGFRPGRFRSANSNRTN